MSAPKATTCSRRASSTYWPLAYAYTAPGTGLDDTNNWILGGEVAETGGF